MTKYEQDKQLLRKYFFDFDLDNNLFSLAFLVKEGRKLLKRNNALELLNDLQKVQKKSKNSVL